MKPIVNLIPGPHRFPVLLHSIHHDHLRDLREMARVFPTAPSPGCIERAIRDGRVPPGGLWFRHEELVAVQVHGYGDPGDLLFEVQGRELAVQYGCTVQVEVDSEESSLRELARRARVDLGEEPLAARKGLFGIGSVDIAFCGRDRSIPGHWPYFKSRTEQAVEKLMAERAAQSIASPASAPSTVCHECKGTGVYVGFMTREPCRACGGKAVG